MFQSPSGSWPVGTSTSGRGGQQLREPALDELAERGVLRLLLEEPGAVGHVAVLVLGDS